MAQTYRHGGPVRRIDPSSVAIGSATVVGTDALAAVGEEDPITADRADYIHNNGSSATCDVVFGGGTGTAWNAMPSDFVSMRALYLSVDLSSANFTDDTCHLDVQFYDSAGVAIGTSQRIFTWAPATPGVDGIVTVTISLEEAALTFAQIKNSYARFTWTYTSNMGGDGGQIRLNAAIIILEYNPTAFDVTKAHWADSDEYRLGPWVVGSAIYRYAREYGRSPIWAMLKSVDAGASWVAVGGTRSWGPQEATVTEEAASAEPTASDGIYRQNWIAGMSSVQVGTDIFVGVVGGEASWVYRFDTTTDTWVGQAMIERKGATTSSLSQIRIAGDDSGNVTVVVNNATMNGITIRRRLSTGAWDPTITTTSYSLIGGWDGIDAGAGGVYFIGASSGTSIPRVLTINSDGTIGSRSTEGYNFNNFTGGWSPKDLIVANGSIHITGKKGSYDLLYETATDSATSTFTTEVVHNDASGPSDYPSLFATANNVYVMAPARISTTQLYPAYFDKSASWAATELALTQVDRSHGFVHNDVLHYLYRTTTASNPDPFYYDTKTFAAAQTVQPSFIDDGAFYSPTSVELTVVAGGIDESTVFAPSIEKTIVPTFVQDGVVYQPTIAATQIISSGFIASEEFVFQPSLSGVAAATIAPPLVDAGSFYAPTVVPAAVTVTPAFFDDSATYAPTLVEEISIAVGFIDSTAATFTPTVPRNSLPASTFGATTTVTRALTGTMDESPSARVNASLSLVACHQGPDGSTSVYWSVHRCIAPNAPTLVRSQETTGPHAYYQLGTMVNLDPGYVLLTWRTNGSGTHAQVIRVSDTDGTLTFGTSVQIASGTHPGYAMRISENEVVVSVDGGLVRVKRTSELGLVVSPLSAWTIPASFNETEVGWSIHGLAYYDHDKIVAFLFDRTTTANQNDGTFHVATYRHAPDGSALKLLDSVALTAYDNVAPGSCPISIRDFPTRIAVGVVTSGGAMTAHVLSFDEAGLITVSAGTQVTAAYTIGWPELAPFREEFSGDATNTFAVAWREDVGGVMTLKYRSVTASGTTAPSVSAVSSIADIGVRGQAGGVVGAHPAVINDRYLFVPANDGTTANQLVVFGINTPEVTPHAYGRFAGGPWEAINESTFYTASLSFTGPQTLTPVFVADDGGVFQPAIVPDQTLSMSFTDSAGVFYTATVENAQPQTITTTFLDDDGGVYAPMTGDAMMDLYTDGGWITGKAHVWNGAEYVSVLAKFMWTDADEWVSV